MPLFHPERNSRFFHCLEKLLICIGEITKFEMYSAMIISINEPLTSENFTHRRFCWFQNSFMYDPTIAILNNIVPLCTLTQHLLLIHAHYIYKSIIINWRATAFYIDWVIQKFSLWMLIRFLWKMFIFYGTNGWPKPNKLSGLYLYIETDHHCLSLWTENFQFAKIHISEN